MKGLRILLFSALLAAQVEPIAQVRATGNDLLRMCANASKIGNLSGKDVDEATYCLGYVLGLSQGLEIGQRIAGDTQTVACAPRAATAGQLALVIEKWLRENPTRLHESAVILASSALRDSFPCPR